MPTRTLSEVDLCNTRLKPRGPEAVPECVVRNQHFHSDRLIIHPRVALVGIQTTCRSRCQGKMPWSGLLCVKHDQPFL